jgi:uncharacterized membrane protein
MEARGLTGVDQSALGDFVFVSRPNRSLSPRQQGLVFWGVALPCMGIASIFAGLGYWLMLPFAGLEVGLLAWAFESLRTHDADYESITIQGQRLILEWRDAGLMCRREWNTYWTQAECVCEHDEYKCRFCVTSHGEAIELGRYLNDQGRIKLAQAVRANLAR